MHQRQSKLLLVSVIILVLLGIGGVVTTQLLHKKPAQPNGPSYNVTTHGLDSTPTPLPDATMTFIKESINRVVTAKHGKATYTAIYRNGSYHRLVTPSGGIVMTLLIDVKETNETYLFTRTGGDNGPSTAYTHCAPEADQLVHPSVCKDPGEGY